MVLTRLYERGLKEQKSEGGYSSYQDPRPGPLEDGIGTGPTTEIRWKEVDDRRPEPQSTTLYGIRRIDRDRTQKFNPLVEGPSRSTFRQL